MAAPNQATFTRLLSATALTLLAFAMLDAKAARTQDAPKIIYGRDDRVETYTLSGTRARNADATVAIVSSDSIRGNGDGTVSLLGPTLRVAEDLCAGERFANQPSRAFCSGVLLTGTVVATAGHCISSGDLADARFVFGYEMIDERAARTTLPLDDVYRGKRILARVKTDNAADYALVELDRPVGGRTPATLGRNTETPVGTPLYIIGHPSGLPAKFADHADVTNNRPRSYFEATLDSFGGNSGSPVFDAVSHRVVGLLVRGGEDYRPGGRGCNVVNVAESGAEDVMRARGGFAPFVPQQ
jgi:hypothetical protein